MPELATDLLGDGLKELPTAAQFQHQVEMLVCLIGIQQVDNGWVGFQLREHSYLPQHQLSPIPMVRLSPLIPPPDDLAGPLCACCLKPQSAYLHKEGILDRSWTDAVRG